MKASCALLGAALLAMSLLVSGCASSGSGTEAIHHGAYAGVHGGHHR
ncbi:hypothetical protein ACUSIJ_03375 [Pseudochelatococcus sp. B33]